MGRRTRILLALIVLIGLCIALGAFIAIHNRLANETRVPDGAPPPPVFDTEPGERAREIYLEFQRITILLDEDLENGEAQTRAFMKTHAGTGWAAEGHYQLAVRYARRDEIGKAIAELDALLALPDQGRRVPRALLLKAQLLRGTDEAAAHKALEAVRKDGRFPDLQMGASLQLGLIALARGDFDGAIALFKPIIESGAPEKAQAANGLEKAVLGRMKTHEDAGKWQVAIAWADARIKEFPDLATLHHALRYRQAGAYRRLGQLARARTYCERLRRDVPEALLGAELDLDGELAAIGQAEEAAGIRRSRGAFLKAKEAGQETREHLEGDIAADTTWDKGPLVLAGPVTVKAGATLTITPGVAVQFLSRARLVVEGAIVARGTADRPIRFTSAVAKAPTFFDGGGVELLDSSVDERCAFEHCIFEYQRTGLTCRAAQPSIRQCSFTRNGVEGLLVVEFAKFTVDGCAFEANDGTGLHARGARSELAVRRCRVVGNGRDGISLTSLSGKLDATIEGNRVEANAGHGIACDLDVAATITGNLIARNKADGIYLNRFSGRKIEGNRIEANKGAGIRCERDSSPDIVGNAIVRSGGNAISLSRSSGQIRGNNILGSGSNAVVLDQNSSPTIQGNWIMMTHGACVHCGEGSAPTLTGNAFAGFDPGALGTVGKMKILAQHNFIGRLKTRTRTRGMDPEVALAQATFVSLSDEKVEEAIFHRADQPQLGEIVWKPRLTEPPPRPPMPTLTDLP